MARKVDRLAQGTRAQRSLPLLALSGALALAVPSAGLALAGQFAPAQAAALTAAITDAGRDALGLGSFTPASVDPELAARVADKARARGVHFTPASAPPISGQRTVTVAVRVDDDTVRAISVRKALDAVPGRGTAALAGLDASKFQLGTARGYKSFARTVDLSANVQKLALPDLAQFEPSRPKAEDKPSRLQPRIALEDRQIAGRSPNTLDASAQSVDVGGSFRLSPNLNVTAGVRYSQERERLDPLTNSVQDSQAVYVGTQIKF